MTGLRSAQFFVVVAAAACSTEFTPQPCSLDGDCSSGMVCEQRDSVNACISAADAPLVIGQSAPLSGTNQDLGTGMKLGIDLAFKEKNAAGGIRGRQLVLRFRDDGYTPELAETAVRELVHAEIMQNLPPNCPSTSNPIMGASIISTNALARGEDAVLAILGNVGTPTMVRAAPVTIETGTVFFGAFTGATTLLRDNTAGACSKYIFNVRASYAQEARATIEYFKKKNIISNSNTTYTHLLSFDQADAYGQSGYEGLVAAFKAVVGQFPTDANTINPIVRFRYTRNEECSVPAQITATQTRLHQLIDTEAGGINGSATLLIGIAMIDTYGAATEYIKGLRTWQYDGQGPYALAKRDRLKLFFSNVSFVGADTLAQRLKALGQVQGMSGPVPDQYYTDNVVVSQVVPNYQKDSSEVITAYKNAINATPGAAPSFTSLEGYIAGRLFIAGLDEHKGPFIASALATTFEGLRNADVGLGVGGFSKDSHQYSNSVWGTLIERDGTFRNLYYWTKDSMIQFFE